MQVYLPSDSIGSNLIISQQNSPYFSHNYCGCFLYSFRQKSSPRVLETITSISNQSAAVSLVGCVTANMLSILGEVRETIALVSS